LRRGCRSSTLSIRMSKRLALVVGIDAYDGIRWPQLDHAVDDAREVAEALTLVEFDFVVTTLYDEEATATRLLTRLVQLKEQAPEILVFYFSGHGGTSAAGSFLVTSDSAPMVEGVNLPVLAQVLQPEAGQSTVGIFDCCHAGAAFIEGASPLPIEQLSARAVEEAFSSDLATSRAVLAACSADAETIETRNLAHGVFTHHLLEGLLGAAADPQGDVSVHSLYDYISRAYDAEVQPPVFRGDIEGRLVLASGFEPRLAPPIGEDAALDLERNAEELLDAYAQHVSAGFATWKESGFRAASQRLEPIYDWFERKIAANPELLKRSAFRALYDSLLTRVAQLGSMDSGTILSEGTLAKRLGGGAFGAVWRVDPPDHGLVVAYKIYHAAELHDVDKVARFRRGFDAMAQLDHPHIVRVFRYTTCPLGFFMGYIQGPNLRELAPATSLDPASTTRLLIEVAETLEHAHNRGVLHRDIKPENIVCSWESEEWEPYLTDFDLAWFSTATQVTQQAFGSLHYAAPEQMVAYSPRATLQRSPTLDVFSFGQLLYFAVTGSDPDALNLEVNAENLEVRAADWPSGEAARQLVELYGNCAAWSPEDRLQDFTQILSLLRDLEREINPRTGADISEPERFKAELVFAFTGKPISADEPTAFTSTSGRTETKIELRERSVDGTARYLVQASVAPRVGVELPGQSYSDLRDVLVSRIDAVLGDSNSARRRHSPGPEFIVEFAVPELDWPTLAQVRDHLARVIAAIEAT
jgi:eukaryotic-like serine/threonine-protein kinase